MKASKLLRILGSFSSDDWKKFSRFILGQASQEIEAHALFKYIMRYKHNLDTNNLELDTVHKRLHPTKTRKGFQNIMSKLTKITEDYIRWDWLNKNTNEYELSLLNAYKSRGLYHLFNLKATQLRNKIQTNNSDDIWSDLIAVRINHDQFFSNNPIKSVSGDELLRKLSKDLVRFTSSLSLFYQGVLIYFGEIKNTDFSDNLKMLEEITYTQEQDDLFNCLNHLVLLNKSKVPQSFDYLYERLINNRLIESKEIQSAVLLSLIHYAYEEFKSGSSDTASEIQLLNEFGVTSELLLVNEKITTTRFVNIVNASCACRNFESAERFIKDYNSLLDNNIREETIQISLAQIRFYQSEYAEVISILKNANYQFFMHNLRMRWMLLCSYFMEYREHVDFMESMIRNYNSFIKNNRQKLSKSNYHSSMNLSRLLKSQMKDPSNSRMLEELEATDEIVFRSWFKQLVLSK